MLNGPQPVGHSGCGARLALAMAAPVLTGRFMVTPAFLCSLISLLKRSFAIDKFFARHLGCLHNIRRECDAAFL